jgi:replicative DNA helicase
MPPHNEEAEASVLGAILLTEQALDGVMLEVGLKPDDFYRPRHQMIFRAMIRLKEKAEPEAVDVVTVCDELRRDSELDKVGGDSYVHALPTIAPAPGAFLHHARIVKEHSLLRRVLLTSREMQEQVLGHRGEARELIERFEANLFRIGHEDGRGEMRSLEDVLHEEIDKLEELSRTDIGLTGTASGFTDLDNLTGGFQPGNLIVLAARPSMGKSTVATNIAENAAIDHERPVALFSLEMSETELAHRFIASQARVSSDELRKGRVKADRWPKVLKAVEKLARAPIFVDDSSDIGVLEIRAKARRLHARKELGLIVVDYLQLVRADGRADSRVEQVGQISRGLKILARELNIPVIAVSQLSRAVESRHPPIPMLSDLRESGQVEQDADVVMFVYRDEYYTKDQSERPGEADIIIAKHRNGPVDTISLAFQPRFPKFSNLYRERVGGLTGGGPPNRGASGNGDSAPGRAAPSRGGTEPGDDPVFGGGSNLDAGPPDDDGPPDDPWNGAG